MLANSARRLWPSVARVAVGLYWLYFAQQKWTGVGWMEGLIRANPAAEPIPGLRQLLEVVVAPNWFFFALAQGIAETVVAVMLIAGLATRWAALGAAMLAAELSLTVAFESGDVGFRWLYYLAVVAALQVMAAGPGPVALERLTFVPRSLRS